MGVETEITNITLAAILLLSTITGSIWLGWKSLLKEHSNFYAEKIPRAKK